MSKTLRKLFDQTTQIVTEAFADHKVVINNITSTALINTFSKGELHIGLNYFITINQKNIFGDVQGNNVDSVLEKLKLKCELEKANFVIFAGTQEDIII